MIYQEMARPVWQYIYVRVGRKGDVADDLTQDTFVEALRSIHNFDRARDIRGWIMGIARHQVTRAYRRLRLSTDAQKALGQMLDMIDRSPWPDELLEKAELIEMVQIAVTGLPHAQRELLRLRYVEERPIRDIAKVLKRSQKSVESELYRCRHTLKARLRSLAEGNE